MKFMQIRGATSIITYADERILIDPVFAPKGAFPPVPSPHNTLRNPLVELPLPVAEISDVNAVIVTHMHHFDHFDEMAAKSLPKNIPIFTQDDEEKEDMRALGFTDSRVLIQSGVNLGQITLYGVEALHGTGESVARSYAERNIKPTASGVVLKAVGEPTVYLAGDTIWYEGIKRNIEQFKPAVIVLNAADARFYDESPILMGTDGIASTAAAAPYATIIISHLDAVNHARVGRSETRAFLEAANLGNRVIVPEDGETVMIER